jgi:hypothetical protein
MDKYKARDKAKEFVKSIYKEMNLTPKCKRILENAVYASLLDVIAVSHIVVVKPRNNTDKSVIVNDAFELANLKNEIEPVLKMDFPGRIYTRDFLEKMNRVKVLEARLKNNRI